MWQGSCIFTYLMALILLQSTQVTCVTHLEGPEYSQIARLAGIQGDVVVLVRIGPDGKVLSAAALSGPSILRPYAERNVSRWIFRPGGEEELKVVYEFKLEKPEVEHAPPLRISFDLPNHVLIVSNFAKTERN